MSEPEQSNESDKNFLERWSRRKREAGSERETVKDGDAAAPRTAAGASTAPAAAAPEPAFDIESLPPIESIGPATDIRAFLQPGVPAELTRAALRRVWREDPAIRNFIGLSENAWDFNDPTAMEGFGPLAPGEAERLLAKLFPEPSKTDAPVDSTTDRAGEAVENPSASPDAQAAARATDETDGDTQIAADQVAPKHSTGVEPVNAAPQQQEPAQPRVFAHLRRGHGGALPE